MKEYEKTDQEIQAKPELGSLEFTSPRTAEEPGPKLPEEEDGCCNHGHGHGEEGHGHSHEEASYVPAVVSLFLLITGIVLDNLNASWFEGYVRLAIYGIAYVLVGGKVIQHAVINISKGSVFNEFFLMSIATIGAFFIGEYAEGVAVMLFYVIGEHFQEAAVAKSRRSIKALIDQRPSEVGLLKNGQVTRVDPHQVAIGDIIQVKAGERVALDGEMLSEISSFNTSALTGESMPDVKERGDMVLAGMINLDKVLDLRVTSTYENTALSKILKVMEEASGRKAKTQKFITRFAKAYTPVVVFLALAIAIFPFFIVESYVFHDWLYRALVFLVISCPCALVISIPLGYFGGIGAASKNGILVKGSTYLDVLSEVDTVVLDKTGTITEGVFKVIETKAIDIDENELINYAAAIENQSHHPVAKAVTSYAGKEYLSLNVEAVEEIPGHGLKGKVNGKDVLAGNSRLLKLFNIPYDPEVELIPETTVLIAINGSFRGYFVIADQLKKDAPLAIQELHELGIREIIMLSGDKENIVRKIAEELKIDKAYGGLLPKEKVDKIEEIQNQGRKVLFVGDGINDAPAITLANVGMAMGGLGSDAAIETADVVIQAGHPSKIPVAIRTGKKTKSIVWQNIGLAFGVKLLVLILGGLGMASLWEAVFADVGVAFLAILNAIRIQK